MAHPRVAAWLAKVSAACFVLSTLLLWVAVSIRQDHRIEGTLHLYEQLDAHLLTVIWEGRRSAQASALFGAFLLCLAWVFALPAVESFAHAMGGQTRSATGALTSAWKVAATLTVVEFVSEAGAAGTADWMSSWELLRNDVNHTHDGGFGAIQALEISYRLTHSRTVWLFAMDRLLLAIGFVTAAGLTYSSATGQFSRGWAHLAMFGAAFCIIGFGLDVARFASWVTFKLAAQAFTAILDAIILPIWLVWLANMLIVIDLQGGAYQVDGNGMPKEIQMQRNLPLGAV